MVALHSGGKRADILFQCLRELDLDMSSFWRQVGMNYVQYSAICARIVRNCLKPEFRAEALKREETTIKLTQWKDGKPIKASSS